MRTALVSTFVLLVLASSLAEAQKGRARPAPKPATVAAGATTAAVQKAVSVKELERSLNALNFDRTTGKEGEAKAAAYVEQRLREYGVKYSRHDVRVLASWPGKAEVALFGEATGSMRAAAPAFGAATPAGGLTAEAVVVPAPVGESGIAQDVRGKIAVLSEPMTPQGVERAQKSAAIGLIFVSETDAIHEGSASPVWGTPALEEKNALPRIPIVTVGKGSGDRLRSALARGPVAVRISAEVRQEWVTVPVIVADMPGVSSDFVLVSAHLDSWYEGMTDSGTGVAALVEMARIIQPQRAKLRRGIRFAWWGGHAAANFAGSAWYADYAWGELDRSCAAHMNVEGAGRRGSRIEAVDAGGWPPLADFSRQTAKLIGAKSVLPPADRPVRPARESDSSFQGIGLSEFWLRVPPLARPSGDVEPGGRVKYWQTKDDKLDRVDLKVLTLDVQYRVAAVYELAQAPVLPLQISPLAGAITRALDDLSSVAGSRFDLGAARQAASALAAAAAKLDSSSRAARVDAASLNRLLIRVSHRLNSALYTARGRFDQDRVADLDLLPLLSGVRRLAALQPDSEDFTPLETRLVRSRNQVEAVLRDATEEIQAFLGVKTT